MSAIRIELHEYVAALRSMVPAHLHPKKLNRAAAPPQARRL
jgi:hypothetical protein